MSRPLPTGFNVLPGLSSGSAGRKNDVDACERIHECAAGLSCEMSPYGSATIWECRVRASGIKAQRAAAQPLLAAPSLVTLSSEHVDHQAAIFRTRPTLGGRRGWPA